MQTGDSEPLEYRAALLLSEYDQLGYAAITGENGVGRTSLLRRIGSLLEKRGQEYRWARCRDREAALRTLREAPPGSTVIVDELEYADLDLLQAFTERLSSGGGVISALSTSNALAPFFQAAAAIPDDSPVAAALEKPACRFRLQPMPPEVMERFIYDHSARQLNAYTVSVIRKLSCGKPGWAIDLIALARAGLLSEGPPTGIGSRQQRDLRLAGLTSLTASIGELDPDTAAAAVVLSEVDPIDPSQAGDLTSDDAVGALTARGALLEEESSGLVTVPPFVAAAVRRHTTPESLADARHRAASQLILQESLGLPLSITDSMFCARELSHFDNTGGSPQEPLLSLLLRTADETLDFASHGSIRALLLRLANQGVQLSGLFGARILTFIGGAKQGFLNLASSRPGQDPAEQLGFMFLAAILSAESTAFGASPSEHPVRDDPVREEAEQVFRLWNTTAPLRAEVQFLREVMRTSESSAVRLAAASLYEHELLWRGHRLNDDEQARYVQLIKSALLAGSAAYRDIIDTALVSYACSMILSDDPFQRSDELHGMVSDLRSAKFQRRWIIHLSAMATALSCGDIARAAMEWKQFEERIPRFLPLRLRTRIKVFGEALDRAAASGADSAVRQQSSAPSSRAQDPEWNATHIVHYIAGRHHALPAAPEAMGDSGRVSLLPLMYQHLTASADQNPSELQRVAAKLFELRLGAPALSALTEAREILIRRRATGAVAQCDRQIAEIEQAMLSRFPWLREEDLPRVLKVRLTPRELATAKLAAQGLSNQEVSRRLGCSIRTVESHLSQARAKLGVSNRHELAGHPLLVGDRGAAD